MPCKLNLYNWVVYVFCVAPYLSNRVKNCPKAVKDLNTYILITMDIVRKMIGTPTKGDNFWECESRLRWSTTHINLRLQLIVGKCKPVHSF